MLFLLKLFNSAFHTKEVNFQCGYVDLLGMGSYACGQEEDILGGSLEVNLNFCLTFQLKESNRFPELSVPVSVFLRVEPFFILFPLEVGEHLFGNLKPTDFISGENEASFNGINLLEPFVVRYDGDSFGQDALACCALEGEISLWIV